MSGITESLLIDHFTDTLFSQDSVVLEHNVSLVAHSSDTSANRRQYLFTVNTGSNTISMFFVDKEDPQHPKLLNTAPTLGDFPVSVAYSSKHKTGKTST